jgi:RNA polymerase sigma factor (sigma-70 family)
MGATRRIGVGLASVRALYQGGTWTGRGDADLLARFRDEADLDSFALLVHRHGGMVLAVCRGRLRDAHDVEDAFQATFFLLAKQARTIADGDRVGGWLRRVADHVARRARRRARRREGHLAWEPTDGTPVTPDLERAEVRGLVREEVGRLPERLRLPVMLCDLEGISRAEAARRLGWPIGTVNSRLARARGLLRQRLRRRGLEAPCGVGASWVELAVKVARDPSALSETVAALAAPASMASKLGLWASALAFAMAVCVGAVVVERSTWGRRGPGVSDDPVPPIAQARRVAASRTVVPRAEWGTIKGRAVFEGDPPEVHVIDFKKAQAKDGKYFAKVRDEPIVERDSMQVDPETKGVRDVFVYLSRPTVVRESARASVAKNVEFHADRGAFVPHALAAMQGSVIVVSTKDPVDYAFRGILPGSEGTIAFDPPQADFPEARQFREHFNFLIKSSYSVKMSPSAVKPLPSHNKQLPWEMADDLHVWNRAYWLILEHPYFAVTDAQGRFEIKDVPVGEQSVIAWHERVGWLMPTRPAPMKVEVAEDGPTVLDFKITPEDLKR